MRPGFFQFKQFEVRQLHSSMKVGTDGVLLGAWAALCKASTALDIGTGTGLLALMLAQRYPALQIKGVELNEEAAKEAMYNISRSPWPGRIKVLQSSIQQFSNQSADQYDAIISNPPFYQETSLVVDKARSMARQTRTLTFGELWKCVDKLLVARGTFDVILPYSVFHEFAEIGEQLGFLLNRTCFVRPTPNKEIHRVMASFNRFKLEEDISELSIELYSRHQYSAEYIALTKAFYLKF